MLLMFLTAAGFLLYTSSRDKYAQYTDFLKLSQVK